MIGRVILVAAHLSSSISNTSFHSNALLLYCCFITKLSPNKFENTRPQKIFTRRSRGSTCLLFMKEEVMYVYCIKINFPDNLYFISAEKKVPFGTELIHSKVFIRILIPCQLCKVLCHSFFIFYDLIFHLFPTSNAVRLILKQNWSPSLKIIKAFMFSRLSL